MDAGGKRFTATIVCWKSNHSSVRNFCPIVFSPHPSSLGTCSASHQGAGESVYCQHDTRTASFVWRSRRLGVTYRPISVFNPFWRRDDDICTRFGELACVRTACCPLAASHLGPTSRGRAQVTLSGTACPWGRRRLISHWPSVLLKCRQWKSFQHQWKGWRVTGQWFRV